MAQAPDGAAAWIVAVASKRCRTAFARLFLAFAPRIKAHLIRQGMTPAVAEDVAQETLLAVWRKAEQFDPERATAGAWIYAIARNQRIDAFRRERRHSSPPLDYTPIPQPTPEQHLKANQDERMVRSALASLPLDQADLMRRSYYGDQSHSRIAGDLGVPLGTVKSRLRNAARRLRLALDDNPKTA